jgi:hypothetical protein
VCACVCVHIYVRVTSAGQSHVLPCYHLHTIEKENVNEIKLMTDLKQIKSN